MGIAHKLRVGLAGRLRRVVPLAPRTWLRVGGPAEFLLEARSQEKIVRARAVCRRLGVPFHLLGEGSNVLVHDAGLAGLVVINRSRAVRWDTRTGSVTADSGVDLDRLVAGISRRGWGDMTFLAGIPGTMGGGLAGGAGAYGRLVGDRLLRARVLEPDGRVTEAAPGALGIGYRDSDLRRRGAIVLEATFGGFAPTAPDILLARIAQIRADRHRKHPPEDLPCAGSFFKNLPPPEPGGRRVPAGKLLDLCGAKGMREGGAAVFRRHANIIVNAGGATAADVHRLAERMAARVRRRLALDLVREVRCLGGPFPG